MSTDISTLVLEVRSGSVVDATGHLGRFGSASDRAAAAVGRLTDRAIKLATAYLTWRTIDAVYTAFIRATSESEKAQAQLAAALQSTNYAAGQGIASLNAHAEALMKLTTFDDEAINGAQALLLTFTRIAGDVFPRATEAVTNLATRMGGDLQGATLQVGKALNDPIAGLTSLGRAGVQFSATQKEMIKDFMNTNQQAKAQGVILDELDRQFGGSARAARSTLGGALQALQNAFQNLFEISGPGAKGLRESIENLITTVSSPKTQQAIQKFGTWLFNVLDVVIKMLIGATNAFQAFLDFIKNQSGQNMGSRPIADLEADINRLTEVAIKAKEKLAAAGPGLGTVGHDAGGWLGTTVGAQDSIDNMVRQVEEMRAEVIRRADPSKFDVNKSFDLLGISETLEGVDALKIALGGIPSTGGGLLPPLVTDEQIADAEKAREAYASLVLGAQERIDQIKTEIAVMGMSTEEGIRFTTMQQLLADATRDGLVLDAKKIANLQRLAGETAAWEMELQKATKAQEQAEEVMNAIGAVVGNVFSGGINSAEEFFDTVLSGFADLGQQNLSSLFSMDSLSTLFNPANDNASGGGISGMIPGLGDAVRKGAEAGTEKGAFGGFDQFFKDKGIKGGAGGALGAGLGGLGMGYQTANPLMGGLGGALQGFATGGIWGAVIGGIAGVVGGLLGMREELRKAKAALEEHRDAIGHYLDAARGIEMSQLASALENFKKQGEEFIKLAEAAGDDALVAQLHAAAEAFREVLGGQLLEDIQASINELSGEGHLNDISDALDRYNERLRDAALLGVPATGALEELNLMIRRIAEDAGLTEEQLAELATLFPDLAELFDDIVGSLPPGMQEDIDRARENLRDAYERESRALQDVITRNKAFIESLQKFKDSLTLNSSLSPLSPQDRLLAAQAEFQNISQLAAAGDETAQGQLQSAAQNYLQAAQAFYASSDQYQAVFDQVQDAIDAALASAESTVSTAEQELELMQREVDVLLNIDRTVLTLREAIDNLAAAMLITPPLIMNDNALAGRETIEELRTMNSRLASLEQTTAAAGLVTAAAARETAATVSDLKRETVHAASARR